MGKNVAGDNFLPDLHGREVDSKIQTFKFYNLDLLDDQSASYCLGKFLSILPHLTDLEIRSCSFHDDFYEEIADQASSSQIQNVRMEGISLERNDSLASRNLARFICALPCLTDLTIEHSQESPSWFSEDFYLELALQGPSSMNSFFNKKLHMDEKSGELMQMDVRQQREYIGHLLHPTLSEITPRPTSRAHQGSAQHSGQKAGTVAESDQSKHEPVPADIDTVIQEAIRSGTAPWNRSRIMVIGPAGVGKTSLINRLTGRE
eukprot:XP_011683832.1 PREDICTED: uncharacterized protein LOC105447460 [Strongylocentrotus purpuratus]